MRLEWSLFVKLNPGAITQDCFVYFPYFVVISPWKRAWPFIWMNLNPFHQRMLCVKVGWNWLIGSREEDLKILSISLIYLPLEKGLALHSNKLNLLYLRMLSAKFVWNWPIGSREDIFKNFINDFWLLNYYLSLEKGMAPHFNKLESTWCIVPNFVEIGP